jgi:ferric-dicitrate binding protein FerR (iron transport regulator)
VLEADPAGSGVVVGREFRGPDLLYWVRAGERQIVALGGASAILEIGTAVRLRVVEAAVAVSPEEPPRA